MPVSPVVRWAAKGDGVTEDNRFVPFAVPGDEVDEAENVTAGPWHVPPPCHHFPRCGGCHLQHASDDALTQYLYDRIVAALIAQGVPMPPIAVPHLSPPRTRRRATLHGERRGREVRLGFNEAGSHKIVDMRECHVLLPKLFALVTPLRALLVALLPSGGRASVTLTRVDQGIELVLGAIRADGLAQLEALNDFASQHRIARLALDDGAGPETRWEPQPVTVSFAGQPVLYPPANFLQATHDGEQALLAAVRVALGDAQPIADLFAGLGTFALPLGAAFAVEGSRDAALALLATRRCQVAHRDLFRRPLTTGELAPFAGIVLDPPRAGALEQVKTLATSPVPRIAYVSCNPATFARDAAILVAGGYKLTHVTPVGQFRWATHVELVGAFAR